MKIKRDDFLNKLELVQYGVAKRESVNLSKCFIFQEDDVFSYNDEILCKINSNLNGTINGAIEAESLLGILRKIPDAELDLEQVNGEVVLKGKRKKDTFRVHSLEDQNMPSKQVECASTWKQLPEGFDDAINMAKECVKEKDPTPSRTCIYVSQRFIQAYDNAQMFRCKIKTPIESDYILLRKEGIKHISNLGMIEFSETENWIHFRNTSGLVYSCRKLLEEYPDLTQFFKVDGESISFPKGLEEIIDRAQEFTKEMADDNVIKVEIKPGKVNIIGVGISGKHEEYRPLKEYSGNEYSFLIAPNLMTNLAKNYQEAELTQNALIVRGPKWVYMAALVSPNEIDMQIDASEDIEEEDIDEDEE